MPPDIPRYHRLLWSSFIHFLISSALSPHLDLSISVSRLRLWSVLLGGMLSFQCLWGLIVMRGVAWKCCISGQTDVDGGHICQVCKCFWSEAKPLDSVSIDWSGYLQTTFFRFSAKNRTFVGYYLYTPNIADVICTRPARVPGRCHEMKIEVT